METATGEVIPVIIGAAETAQAPEAARKHLRARQGREQRRAVKLLQDVSR
jgi:hypothetical protein